ncbi:MULTISPECIES: hypothetical protein [Actinomycetes]|uniref:DUF559 domain-containing protein n=2 Tax=Actinomycetes TaxID=1760 RepID=A0ABP6M091_9MICC
MSRPAPASAPGPDPSRPSRRVSRRAVRGLPRAAWQSRGYSDEDLRRGVRRGELLRLGRGLYSAGLTVDDPALQARLTLQALTADGQHAASHATAAALLGLPGHRPGDGAAPLGPPFHLTRVDGRKALRRDGLVLGYRARVPASQLVRVAGVLSTGPARTWVDLARESTVDELVVLADQLIRIPRPEFEGIVEPWTDLETLRGVVQGRRGTPGAATARAALELARVGSDSPRETQLRLALHRAGLPEPEVNAWILDESGRAVHQPDLMLRRWRIAINYEGRHHSDPLQIERDVARQEGLQLLGWEDLRITDRRSRDVWRPAVEKVTGSLLRAGWWPGCPW